MGRQYIISFDRVAVTAIQDLFEILVPADKAMILHEFHITQDSDAGDAQSEQLHVEVQRVTGSPTSGSGGSAATPRPTDGGDAAAGITAEVNNTTQLSGGTAVTLASEAGNVMNGVHFTPVPESRPSFAGQTRCLISLSAAPADSLTMSGWASVEEIG